MSTNLPRRARRFSEFLQARVERASPERYIYDKLRIKEIGRAAGVPVPETFAVYDAPEAVSLDHPLPFVLKPTLSADKRGVHVLTERVGRGYRDALTGRLVTAEGIAGELRAALGGRCARNQFLVEEKVAGANKGIPFDYKFYVIGGEVVMGTMFDRNTQPTSMAVFDPSWTDVPEEEVLRPASAPVQHRSVALPPHADQLTDAAQKVAREIDANLIRVDLYATTDGPLLGEITYASGPAHFARMYRFSPAFDAALGKRWAEANERLGLPIPTITEEPPTIRRELAERRAS